MNKNNIKINNISPFLNESVIKKSSIDSIFIKNIIFEKLPLLPGINFKDKSQDPIGSSIINAYYNIKVNLRKLELIKTFIISIIKCNESYFKKITIQKQSYSITKKKLIIKFKDTFGQTFKQDFPTFVDFVDNFIKNKYGLIDKNNEEIPFFFRIFLREYNGKNKLFFKKLFNQYIGIRKNLLKYLVVNNLNYGILAFSFVFDLPRENFNTEIKSNNKQNNNNNNNNNLNSYIVLNSIGINNGNAKDDVKVGDIVTINSTSTSKNGTIIKIDYSNQKPYLIKTDTNTKKYDKNEINIKKNKPKLKLNQKISDNDLLYRNVFDKQMFKDNHLKNINKKYSDLLESTKNFVGQNSTQSFSLNDIIKNNIEVDYNIFDFIFNYVDPLLFDKAVDENYSIKDNISRRMDQFDLYYEQYINWFNELKGFTEKINNSNYGLNISDFQNFFDTILKNVTTST